MKNRISFLIFVLCIVIGFFIAIGAVGALEFNSVNYVQFFTQGGIGSILIWIGFIGLKCGDDRAN